MWNNYEFIFFKRGAMVFYFLCKGGGEVILSLGNIAPSSSKKFIIVPQKKMQKNCSKITYSYYNKKKEKNLLIILTSSYCMRGKIIVIHS